MGEMNREADRQTDGQTDGQASRVSLSIGRLHNNFSKHTI